MTFSEGGVLCLDLDSTYASINVTSFVCIVSPHCIYMYVNKLLHCFLTFIGFSITSIIKNLLTKDILITIGYIHSGIKKL